ncbi:MAG: phospholipase A [Pseudomonadota bacterium]
MNSSMRRVLILLVVLLCAASVVMAQTPARWQPAAALNLAAVNAEPENAEPVKTEQPPAGEPPATGAADATVTAEADEVVESQRHALLQFIDSKGGVSFHKDMFIAPFSYNERFTGSESETVFQLSFKARILGGPLFFGYTQRSFWQAYDSEESAPFRETNYNPEVFARFQPGNWLSRQWGFDVGIEHESNGKRVPESRSWNKVYGAMFHEGDDDVIWLKAWYRLPEKKKDDPLDAEGDDNPDIDDYYGDAELRYRRCLDGKVCRHLFNGMVRGNLETGKGAIELSWSFPTGSEQTSWYIYLFSGYGESLIDYNNAENRIAIGVTLRPQ